MKKTDPATMVKALRVLSAEIYSEDGVANACIAEGAEMIADHIMDQKKMANMESALKVIHTWSTFEGGAHLDARHVAHLTGKVLGVEQEKT